MIHKEEGEGLEKEEEMEEAGIEGGEDGLRDEGLGLGMNLVVPAVE